VTHPTEQEYIAHYRELHPSALEGFIKLKLVHSEATSLVIPDFLAANLDGMRWFQPKFFYGCTLSFFDRSAAATIRIELSSGSLVEVTFVSSGLVTSLSDSSQVYECVFSQLSGTRFVADGTCSRREDGDFLLRLFHHTTNEAAEAINSSGHFRGSRWNVQGTRELKNVEFAYFTSLPKIASEADLAKIAMASSGQIYLLRTNAVSRTEAVTIKVYRQSTLDRTATLAIAVPASLVASQHIYRHVPRGEAAYYEVCNPYIYRVGLQPGKVAPFHGSTLAVPEQDRMHFEYMVLGDADTAEGLIAPFNEEETKSLFHVQDCSPLSFFEFWRKHANSDQVSWRTPDLLQFKDSD